MLKPELYKKTTDILFDAYFNDTLIHGSCASCAVGNIISANLGIQLRDGAEGMEFIELKINDAVAWFKAIQYGKDSPAASEQIESTGYSIGQIIRIENAFEDCRYGNSQEEYIFNGLVAVIDVLNEIHKVEADEQKPRFESHYKTKLQTA